MHNCTLYEGLGANQLVVGGVVDHIKDACFLGSGLDEQKNATLRNKYDDNLRAPAKCASLKAQSTKFQIASTTANDMNALGANLG